MPPKQRQIRIEQKGQMQALQQLETKSDEELEAETKFKSAAQTILGMRAAEAMDAKRARAHFQRALAAARPQERLQIRRMADYALAHAERRPDDLKASMEKLGLDAPTGKQMVGLRIVSLLVPPKSAGTVARIRGVVLIILLIALILFAGFGIVSGIAAAAGGMSLDLRIFWGIVLVLVALGALAFFGRRRQKNLKAKRAEEVAARTR
jgi:uncharacterized membrane protein